ncbi:MAG: ribosome maturation factor RimM [Chthonomonadales bacterium]
MLDEWNWTIGTIIAPFGRAGEVRIRYDTDFPERFARLTQVCLRNTQGVARLFAVESVRPHKAGAVLKLEGLESINQAEEWRGARIQVMRTQAEPLGTDEYYVADLVGMEVVTASGRRLGVLEEVLPYPAQDLFRIGEILIPAVKEFIREVNLTDRRIVVAPPQGLLPEDAAEPGDAD